MLQHILIVKILCNFLNMKLKVNDETSRLFWPGSLIHHLLQIEALTFILIYTLCLVLKWLSGGKTAARQYQQGC